MKYNHVFMTVKCTTGLIPQSLQLQAQVTYSAQDDVKSGDWTRICVCLNQRVSATTMANMSVFFCLNCSCNTVNGVGQ